MKKSHVPAFGSWDCNDDLPFTQCFESARQAGLLRYSYSEDRDLYVAGDLYQNDIVTPAMIVVPRRRVRQSFDFSHLSMFLPLIFCTRNMKIHDTRSSSGLHFRTVTRWNAFVMKINLNIIFSRCMWEKSEFRIFLVCLCCYFGYLYLGKWWINKCMVHRQKQPQGKKKDGWFVNVSTSMMWSNHRAL